MIGLSKLLSSHDWLIKAFVPHDWLIKAFVLHDWLIKAFVLHDWLIKASTQRVPERFSTIKNKIGRKEHGTQVRNRLAIWNKWGVWKNIHEILSPGGF